MHEDWAPEGGKSLAECKKQVASCDALVLMVGSRFGYIVPLEDGGTGKHSITQLEVQHAEASGVAVYRFIVEPSPPLLPEEVEPDSSRQSLEEFKRELKTLLVAAVSTPTEFRAKLAEALSSLRLRLILQNVLAAAVLVFAAVTIGVVVRERTRQPEPGPVPPPLLSYIHGAIRTRSGTRPGAVSVHLECLPSQTAISSTDGEYSLSMLQAPDSCRSLPVRLIGETADHRRFSGEATSADAANFEIDDPQNSISTVSELGTQRFEVRFARDLPKDRLLLLHEFPIDPHQTRRDDAVLIVRQHPSNRVGTVVASTKPLADSVVTLNAPASVEAAVAQITSRLLAAGAGGLDSLEQVLRELAASGVDRKLVSRAYQQVADASTGNDCVSLRRAVKWLRLAAGRDNAQQFRSRIVDLEARVTLACNSR